MKSLARLVGELDVVSTAAQPRRRLFHESPDQVVVDEEGGSGDQDRIEGVGLLVGEKRAKRRDRATRLLVHQVLDPGLGGGRLLVVGHHDGADAVAEDLRLGLEDVEQRPDLGVRVGHDPPDGRGARLGARLGDLHPQHAQPGDGLLGQLVVLGRSRAPEAVANVAVEHGNEYGKFRSILEAEARRQGRHRLRQGDAPAIEIEPRRIGKGLVAPLEGHPVLDRPRRKLEPREHPHGPVGQRLDPVRVFTVRRTAELVDDLVKLLVGVGDVAHLGVGRPDKVGEVLKGRQVPLLDERRDGDLEVDGTEKGAVPLHVLFTAPLHGGRSGGEP